MSSIVRQLMRAGNSAAVALYRRTGGRLGGSVRGIPLLLLTIPGRTTGVPRTVAVASFEHEGSYLVVGSAGGSKHDPQWMKNLRATGSAHIEIAGRQREVTVRIAEPAERDALWSTVVVPQAPFFAGYERKAGRVIPIALLTPSDV